MDIKSILDNIKYSIAEGYNGKIHISEVSYLLDIVDEKESDNKHYIPHFPVFPNGHRFPISCFFLKLLLCLVEGPIWLMYTILRGIRLLFLGNKKDISTSPRVNLVLFVGVIVFLCVSIIFVFIFFIKSVLLFNPKGNINEQGAIIVPQDCGREQYMFLFNTATFWANTGIKVLEGDEIEVSASGSFFSKISDMNGCAKDNRLPNYSRTLISYQPRVEQNDFSSRPLWVYRDPHDSRFGSLLLQIKEDSEELLDSCIDNDNERIKQLDFSQEKNTSAHIPIKRSGVLYFAINDIYLTDVVIRKIQNKDGYKSNFEFKTDKSSLPISIDMLSDNDFRLVPRDMWFDDNVGEVLLNIRVIRDVLPDNSFKPAFIVKLYRWMETKVYSASFGDVIRCLLIGSMWLIVDYFIGLGIRKRSQRKIKIKHEIE